MVAAPAVRLLAALVAALVDSTAAAAPLLSLLGGAVNITEGSLLVTEGGAQFEARFGPSVANAVSWHWQAAAGQNGRCIQAAVGEPKQNETAVYCGGLTPAAAVSLRASHGNRTDAFNITTCAGPPRIKQRPSPHYTKVCWQLSSKCLFAAPVFQVFVSSPTHPTLHTARVHANRSCFRVPDALWDNATELTVLVLGRWRGEGGAGGLPIRVQLFLPDSWAPYLAGLLLLLVGVPFHLYLLRRRRRQMRGAHSICGDQRLPHRRRCSPGGVEGGADDDDQKDDGYLTPSTEELTTPPPSPPSPLPRRPSHPRFACHGCDDHDGLQGALEMQQLSLRFPTVVCPSAPPPSPPRGKRPPTPPPRPTPSPRPRR